jgi:hypothetical protein
MSSYLLLTMYDPDSEMNQSDQITVPAELWETLDRDHEGEASGNPMFVEMGSGVIGRLRPAVPADQLSGDSCRVPHWMWMLLDPQTGEDSWVSLAPCQLPTAGTIVLRARQEADLTGAVDPVAMLTAALSGSAGGLSWACLNAGAELPLACGVFDVMEIRSVEDFVVPAACILDCDVNLDLVPALDAETASTVSEAVAEPEAEPITPPQVAASFTEPAPRASGFVPFSGVGRRLCD